MPAWGYAIIIIAALIVIIGIIFLSWWINTANRMRRELVKIDEAASGIDVALTKRFDLLTKEVAVVKGYAKHESETLTNVIAMMIAGYAFGASQGYFYVRAEYPVAVERLLRAMDDMRKVGLLGDHILGTDFSFDVHLREGAGAFVCGEETALLNSIEGKRGMW